MRRKIAVLFYCCIVGVFAGIVTGVLYWSYLRQDRGTKRAVDSRVRGNEKVKFDATLPGINTIFADDHSWTATLSAEKITKLLVTGDIIPARSVNAGVILRNNPLWPYEKVIPFITSLQADITFINLETPLLKNCPSSVDGMIFCGNNRNIEGLQVIGADIVSVANNHFGNHGQEGILESLQLLDAANMTAVGIGGPVYKTIKDLKFAFLAFNDIEKQVNGINLAEDELIASQIQEAKLKSDIIIVMYHWGAEYRAQPDERQVYLAHYTIDSGADLVVSNHPHWIQPVEIYKGKLVMYAHGNFIFDQMWSENTREGVLGLYSFYDQQLIDVQFFPLKIYDYGQPEFLRGKEKQKILDEMLAESLLLKVRGLKKNK